ncbi:MAG TPA: ATP-binding protein [Archangium sp.]
MTTTKSLIRREILTQRIRSALRRSPVVALLGPRQCGKTTLAETVEPRAVRFDLEDPAALGALDAPMATLGPLEGLIVFDEILRLPSLFAALRVRADKASESKRFLILGSASPELVAGASESLAGRVEFVDMGGFSLDEVGVESWRRLWWRGGFPRSFLAESDEDSSVWRENFARTFLERDIPQLGLRIAPLNLRRFWTIVAHYHGKVWNHAEVGSALGLDEKTVRRYLDVLAGAFMLRVLPPWFENVGKRQRKAPKAYVRDSGMLHTLLSLDSPERMLSHPALGASFEGFALELVAEALPTRDLYYWAVHSGPELDLLAFVSGRRVGFEFKYSDAPTLTPSMTQALEHLQLDALKVVYPGTRRYSLGERVEALPLADAVEWARRGAS